MSLAPNEIPITGGLVALIPVTVKKSVDGSDGGYGGAVVAISDGALADVEWDGSNSWIKVTPKDLKGTATITFQISTLPGDEPGLVIAAKTVTFVAGVELTLGDVVLVPA